MKKYFNEPEMMISIFSDNDVITASGGLGNEAIKELKSQSNKISLDGKSTITSDLIYIDFDMSK